MFLHISITFPIHITSSHCLHKTTIIRCPVHLQPPRSTRKIYFISYLIRKQKRDFPKVCRVKKFDISSQCFQNYVPIGYVYDSMIDHCYGFKSN